ncbi:hypothetical protein CHS0354_028617 [Potamilus streckersoni]|uniref:Uncharacterized protein n=1 Tax=Potamilus streckersoni TaxID=2493646 RepID=A0AAE0RUW4_9BIVA|nr:hypothetical protein CHS0354_028617 [Potamilus streckersoni]
MTTVLGVKAPEDSREDEGESSYDGRTGAPFKFPISLPEDPWQQLLTHCNKSKDSYTAKTRKKAPMTTNTCDISATRGKAGEFLLTPSGFNRPYAPFLRSDIDLLASGTDSNKWSGGSSFPLNSRSKAFNQWGFSPMNTSNSRQIVVCCAHNPLIP